MAGGAAVRAGEAVPGDLHGLLWTGVEAREREVQGKSLFLLSRREIRIIHSEFDMLSQRCRVPAETPEYLGFLWGPGSFQIAEGELWDGHLLPQYPNGGIATLTALMGISQGREQRGNLARRKLKTIGYSENVVTSGRLTEAL